MVSTFVPNSVSRRTVLAGTETVRGAAVTPTYRWRGELEINRSRDVNRAPEATGTRDRLVTPNLGLPSFDGTYGEQLTFQSLGQHARYWLKAGDPAVGDSAAGTEAFTRAFVPGDTLDSATLEYGFPGLGFRSVGVLHNEGTITFDFDDADGVWKFSSSLLPASKDALPGTEKHATTTATSTVLTVSGATWTVNEYAGAWVTILDGAGYGQQRQVVSNTATALTVAPAFSPAPTVGDRFRVEGLFTAGISVPNEVKIATPGTKVYIDPADGTIGSTQVRNRMISGNITVANALAPKWFLENIDNPSNKMDEGDRIISGQLQMEFDRRDEYEQLSNLDEVAIRIAKTGPVIDATEGSNYLAQIDVARAVWTNYTPGTRQNNITATFAFDAYVPAASDILEVTTITPQATLY